MSLSRRWAFGFVLVGADGLDVVAIAYDDGGGDEKQEAGGYEEFGAAGCSAPLVEDDAPEGGEDDDAGHVEGPGGEVVLAHPGLAHGVEEKLEVPDDAGECGEEVVEDKGAGRDAAVSGRFQRIEVDEGVSGGLGGAHGVEAGLTDELADGAVLEDEDGRPDEVGDEASPEHDDEDGEILPKVETACGEEL